jgi:membrane-associated protease RseP (regulator of RpoE activity)
MFNKPIPKLILQLFLFVLTIVTTTLSGAEWIGLPCKTLEEAFSIGLSYSVPFLLLLTVHEFGHFFTARHYNVPVSLPYFIPVYFLGFIASIGTMGAFIRMKPAFTTTRQYFDIGIAGPLAGFVTAMGFLIYGFNHLPEKEYIYKIHPEYKQFGLAYENHVYNQSFLRLSDSLHHVQINSNQAFKPAEHYEMFAIGENLLFYIFKNYVVDDATRVPNKYELMHYPILFAAYLALFFTSLNLIPIGQLDGGHVLYGLIGYEKHAIVSKVLLILFVAFASLGFVNFKLNQEEVIKDILLLGLILWTLFRPLFKDWKNVLLVSLAVMVLELSSSTLFPSISGYSGWLFFAFILSRFLGIQHPKASVEMPLNLSRKILGWIALLIFVFCFSPQPFLLN